MMVACPFVPTDTLFGVPLCSLKLSCEAERTPAKMMGLDQEVSLGPPPS